MSAGLADRVANDEVDETRLGLKSFRDCRLLDRSLHFVLGHRPEQHVVRRDVSGELFVWRAVPVEVRSHRDDGLPTSAQELVEEPSPPRLVGAQGEGLLQLIDHEQLTVAIQVRGLERRDRIGPGREQRRARHPRNVTSAHSRDDSGANQRRLARTGCPDDGDEPTAAEPGQDVVEDVVAAEEQVRVVRLELQEAAIRALGGRRHRRQRRCRQRVHVLRLTEAAQAVGPEVDEPEAVGKTGGQEPGGGL
jgi:hypothetical protein